MFCREGSKGLWGGKCRIIPSHFSAQSIVALLFIPRHAKWDAACPDLIQSFILSVLLLEHSLNTHLFVKGKKKADACRNL